LRLCPVSRCDASRTSREALLIILVILVILVLCLAIGADQGDVFLQQFLFGGLGGIHLMVVGEFYT